MPTGGSKHVRVLFSLSLPAWWCGSLPLLSWNFFSVSTTAAAAAVAVAAPVSSWIKEDEEEEKREG